MTRARWFVALHPVRSVNDVVVSGPNSEREVCTRSRVARHHAAVPIGFTSMALPHDRDLAPDLFSELYSLEFDTLLSDPCLEHRGKPLV